MSDGVAYTKHEFVAYGVSNGLGTTFGINMWNESIPEQEDVPNYGNWGGVAVALPRLRLYFPDKSQYEMPRVFLRRSRSCGELTESGRATIRHPHGHPTASGLGWIAAT